LDTNTTQTPDHTFTNTSGLDIIDSGNLANFTFIDKVPAALKPKEGGFGGGIQVVSDAGNATLRIEGTADDRAYTVLSSTSSETVVRITDITTDTGRAVASAGVTNLVIRTNDFSGAQNHWPTFPNPGSSVSVPMLAAGINLAVDTGASTYATVKLGGDSGFIFE
jgi:hypothetical protein